MTGKNRIMIYDPKDDGTFVAMSSTLIITIASLALVVSVDSAAAQQQRMPAELVGEWCGVATDPALGNLPEELPAMYRPGDCRDTDGWMTITQDGYRAHEMGCKLLNATMDAGDAGL
jgi:hypothetical protein